MKETKRNDQLVYFHKQKVGDMAKRLPTAEGRWGLWKYLFAQGMTGMFQLNVSAFICFLPVIVVAYLFAMGSMSISSSLPFTSFIGAGYPAVVDAAEKAFTSTQELFFEFGVLLMPCALFISLYLSQSVQYAMRNFVWTEGHFKFKTLFKSFKFNWKQPIFISLITSVIAMGIFYLVYLLRAYLYLHGWNVWAVLMVIGIAAVALFVVMITMYAYSISITYKESLLAVYYDAVFLSIRLFVTNILVEIAVLAPIALVALLTSTAFGMLVIMAMVFIGFSYMLLTWAVYSQYVFDLATNKLNGNNPYAKQEKTL